MDILNNPITSRKDFVKRFSMNFEDKENMKEQFKAIKKELKKTKISGSSLVTYSDLMNFYHGIENPLENNFKPFKNIINKQIK